jgi:lysophospholipase L1-like esterase
VIALVAAAGCTSTDGPLTVHIADDAGSEGLEIAPTNEDAAPLDDASHPRDAGTADAGEDAAVDAEVAPFHVIGRVDLRDPAGPRFGWPGTKIRARFAGSGIAFELEDSGTSHYDVSIDGGPPSILVVSGGPATYELASGLPPGSHEVVVTKRTETFLGVTQLLDVRATRGGTLIPTPVPRGRRMEIVGDSITCGYGVLGPDETCPFSADTQSEPLAWGALAAKSLSAMHTSIAVSGIGVFRNYAGDIQDTMPERYGRSIADDPSSAWDHSFVPDVIVVNLGTNDFAGGKGDPGPVFQETYVAFLATLRATHPTAHIVATTSPMLSGSNASAHRAYVEAAIAQRKAAGDARISFLAIEEQRPEDGLGCGFHPSRVTQQKMATRLVSHVKPRLGW